MDVGSLLLQSSAYRPALRKIDLGRDHAHWAADGGILPTNKAADLDKKAMALGGRYLVIPPARRGYMGCKFGVDEDPHIHAP